MPDHIHIFIKASPKITVETIVRELKGFISYKIRSTIPLLKKYRAFWAKGYFAESVGFISEEVIKKYIDNQWTAYHSGDSSHD